MEALDGFYSDEKGMVPYTLLGITMLLIVGASVYHFNNVDIIKAQERVSQTFDMETFYATARVGQDLQQAVRASAESTVLEHSMSTYARPIDVNVEWGTEGSFENWKRELGDEISKSARKEVYGFYLGGNKSALEKRYYNPSTDFDFSNFLLQEEDIEVSVTPDRYDLSMKVQRPLELKVGFKEGGTVSSKNRFTGYEMSIPIGTIVTSDVRPFTMADRVYNFTQMFNERDSADELAWYVWGMQEVMGLLEANVKHSVKFATDDRATYSLMQLIIAYKELEYFGTFDYVHTTLEFLRPWVGSEAEASEFLSLFQESIEGGYVDQAIESMDAAIFVRNLASRVDGISDSMIIASSYLDSKTVTGAGGGFDRPAVEGLQLPGEGTVQHLKRAEDTRKLADVYDAIEGTRSAVAGAKADVGDDTINSLGVGAQLAPLKTEWSEVRDELKNAKNTFALSQMAVISARDGYLSLSTYIDAEKCSNPVAAMLWFGDSNQNVKGFREILPAKVNETDELVEYYRDLEVAINALEYIDDDYQIDAHYNNAKDALKKAEANLQKARDAKNAYDRWTYKQDLCSVGFPCATSISEPNDCKTGELEGWCIKSERENVECCEETAIGGETCYTCDTITSYDCICGDKYLKNAQNAEVKYKNQMKLAETNLETAAIEVSALQTQIDAFFLDRGLDDVYVRIGNTHGMYGEQTKEPLERAPRPYSISDNYYSHWNYSSCQSDTTIPSKKYVCAKTVVPNPLFPIDSTNYDSQIPKSPLTYDVSHKDYDDYGLYYIKYVTDKMDETFGDESINVDTLKEGKDALERMKNSGFFETILDILKPVNELLDVAGDIKSEVATIKDVDKTFPNINDHFYTTLPLPPFNGSKIGFEDPGFTVIHDIRLRADTRPGEIKLPLIGSVTLGKDNAVNPSLPIPYTPISMYLWEFEIGPSTGKDSDPEYSTLWLIDMESTQIAPLMDIEIGDYKVPVPLYLHKPIMYKYTFTPEETISKGLDRLPPVFVLSLGPFKTRFKSYMEPPDREITDNPLAVNASFDREFVSDRAVLTVTAKENISIKKYIAELVNGNSYSLRSDKEEILAKDLRLLDEYGWSEVSADIYVTDGKPGGLNTGDFKGEDHTRVYFIDDSLTAVGITVKKGNYSKKLNVINTGSHRVDVAIRPAPGSGCVFILYEGSLAKNWIGTIGPGATATFDIIAEGGAKITGRVLMPEKVEKELRGRGVSLALEDGT